MSATTIIYSRVSTADQDLDHQREALWEYAVENLGVAADDLDVLEDRSTGTDVDRSGYRRLIERVREGDVEQVVVRSVSRIARNMRDLYATVDDIVENGTGLHIVNDGIEIAPGEEMDLRDRILLNTFALAAELEAEMLKQRTVEGLRAAESAGKHIGRPPYGFETDDDGYLIPSEEYPAARDAIEAVEELGWSVRKAARHTGIPRRTVSNILERRSLYRDVE